MRKLQVPIIIGKGNLIALPTKIVRNTPPKSTRWL